MVEAILNEPRFFKAPPAFWDEVMKDYPEDDELMSELKHRWHSAEKRECYYA